MLFGFLGINLEAPYDNPEKNLEKISGIIISKWSFLEWKTLTENFWKDKNNIDENFINNLKNISKTENHKDFSKNLEKLFKKSGEFENFINDSELKKLEWFENKNNLVNEKWEIIYENLKYLTEIYKEYLQEKENKKISSISEFVNKKTSTNNEIENEVFWTWSENTTTQENSQNSGENILEQNNDLTKKAEEAIAQNRQEKQNTENTTANVTLTSAVWASLAASSREKMEAKPTENKTSETKETPKPAEQKPADPKKEPAKQNENKKEEAKNTETTKPVEQNPKTQTESKKPEQNNFIINKNENIEFGKEKVSFVFEVSGKKYEASLYWNQKWYLTITWNGEKVIFNWWKELYDNLSKFNWKLDKEAEASDFWKNVWMINPKLGTSIKNILINGYEDKPWLKQILSQNFFNSWTLVKNNVSINFSDKNYNLNFEKAEWQKLA